MARPREDKTRIQCRMDTNKKLELDKRLVKAGFAFKSGENVYPMYAEFLEGLVDGDKKALEIILDGVLDKLE